MTEEEEREKKRYELHERAYWIIEGLVKEGITKKYLFEALPFIFVRLCNELEKDYGPELIAFMKIAKAYRSWLRKKEEVKK